MSGSDAAPNNLMKAHDYNNFYNMYGGVGPFDYAAYLNPSNLNTNETEINPYYDTNTYGLGAYLMAPAVLKGKGVNGSDIGANIIYESVNAD
jgi:hypothetical protein